MRIRASSSAFTAVLAPASPNCPLPAVPTDCAGGKAAKIAERLVLSLPRTLLAGESSGVLAARRTATAIQVRWVLAHAGGMPACV